MRISSLVIAPSALLGVAAGAGLIPIQNTPIYNTPSIEVQIGIPLRTVRLEPTFYGPISFPSAHLLYPTVCPAFVVCIGIPHPVDPPELEEVADGGDNDVRPWAINGLANVMLGEYSNASYPVRYVVMNLGYTAAPTLAGTFGLDPNSPIALSNVIELNTETLVHPDGSTEPGQSIKLHPDGITVEPGDVIAPILPTLFMWYLRPTPHIGSTPLSDRAMLYMDRSEGHNPKLMNLTVDSFPIVVDVVRGLVGNVEVVNDQLYVPCLEEGVPDPLFRQLSFQFGTGDAAQRVYVNMRNAPVKESPLTGVDGIQYCPTLLLNSGVSDPFEMELVPDMLDGNMTTFLDSFNWRVVFRSNSIPRAPLPVDPIPLAPSFILPDPASGSVHFPASDTPAWRLVSPRPHVRDDGSLVYTLDLYNTTDAPDRNVTTEYADEYYLVGHGVINDSDPSMISLPVSLEGLNRRYRITQRITRVKATYVLTPVTSPLLAL